MLGLRRCVYERVFAPAALAAALAPFWRVFGGLTRTPARLVLPMSCLLFDLVAHSPLSHPTLLPHASAFVGRSASLVRRELVAASVRALPPFSASAALLSTFTTLLLTGLASSTLSSYQTHETSYLQFCSDFGCAPLPVLEATVLGFMCQYFTLGKSFSTLKVALSAIRNLSRLAGLPVGALETLRVLLLKRAYKRTIPNRPARKPRIPITIWVLALFVPLLGTNDAVPFALSCVGVYGLFRGGELTAKGTKYPVLRRQDVTWLDSAVVIRLLESKSDIERCGVDVTLYKSPESSPTCAYSRLRDIWATAPDQSPCAPLFQQSNGTPVTYAFMLKWVKTMCQRAGVDPDRVGLHSFRIGGATSLAFLGVPAHVIKILGRWESLAYQLYTRTSAAELRAYMEKMYHSAQSPVSPQAVFGGLSAARASLLSEDDLDSLVPAVAFSSSMRT